MIPDQRRSPTSITVGFAFAGVLPTAGFRSSAREGSTLQISRSRARYVSPLLKVGRSSSSFSNGFHGNSLFSPLNIRSGTFHKLRNATLVTMRLDRVVIAGGTGFVGTRLVEKLVSNGSSVVVLTRRPPSTGASSGIKYVRWNPTAPSTSERDSVWIDEISGADSVINLCGESIATRWTPAKKKQIRDSRLNPTNALVSALGKLTQKDRPKSLINASAVGYYGDDVAPSKVLTEGSQPGDDFLAKLCDEWERSANAAREIADVRVCIMRLGIVLGLEGGALAKMVPAFQAFVGGPLGSGRQWFPWVHVDDVVNALITAAENESYQGVFNCVAPNIVSMNEMANSLGRALNRPAFLPVPDFVLQILLGEASSFLLKGQQAVPQRLTDSGFQFEFRDIDSALQNIVNKS